MSKKFTFAVLAIFVVALSLFANISVASAANIDIEIATLDQDLNPVAGKISVQGYVTQLPSPQTVSLPTEKGINIFGYYIGSVGSSYSTRVAMDTTIRINVSTAEITRISTPGINRVEFVYNIIPEILFDTVDQSGNPLAGTVTAYTTTAGSTIILPNGSPSPARANNIPEGSSISVAGAYLGKSSGSVLPYKAKINTTAKIDTITREIIYVPTPGITKVEFIFNLIPEIIFDTVDQNGNHLPGKITGYLSGPTGIFENNSIYADSPATAFNLPEGVTLRINGSSGEVTLSSVVLHKATKDVTTQVNVPTKEINYITTPGTTKIQFVFESTVPVDTTAPITTISVSSAAGQNGWYIAPVTVSLSASDEGAAGVKETRICVDQENLCVPAVGNSAEITNEGKNYVRYFSVDNAGNSEEIKSEVVNIDNTAPISSLSAEDSDGDSFLNSSTVTISATDMGSGVSAIKYSIDNGETFTLTSNPASIVLPMGVHVLAFSSVDNAGNTEAIQTRTLNSPDACPNIAGKTEYNGCPMAIVANVTVLTHDKARTGVCGNLPNGKPKPNCKVPLSDTEVRVFDVNNAGFVSSFGVEGFNKKASDIFSSGLGLVGSCTTDASGVCKTGAGAEGKYLAIAKLVDGSKEVYAGKEADLFGEIASLDIMFSKFIEKNGDVEYKHEGLALVPINNGKWPLMLAFLSSLFSGIL